MHASMSADLFPHGHHGQQSHGQQSLNTFLLYGNAYIVSGIRTIKDKQTNKKAKKQTPNHRKTSKQKNQTEIPALLISLGKGIPTPLQQIPHP